MWGNGRLLYKYVKNNVRRFNDVNFLLMTYDLAELLPEENFNMDT